jgi:phosphatidylserine decarboxylase
MKELNAFLQMPETKKLTEMPPRQILERELSRDPIRPIYYDMNVVYAPADGFVIYNKVVGPNEEIINVKGGTYSVNTLLREEVKEDCLVIGIFMTCIDIHVQHAPVSGFLFYEKMPSLKVTNLSMRPIEKAILDRIKVNINAMQYALYNERMKCKIVCPRINQHMHLLLTGDFEIDVVCMFGPSGNFYTQGEKISLVRQGSQADLIIPLVAKNRIKFQSLIPNDGKVYHVEGGIDPIVKVERMSQA